MDEDALSQFEDLLEVLRRNRVSKYAYGPTGLKIEFLAPEENLGAEPEVEGFVRQSDRINAREEREKVVKDSNDPYKHPSIGKLIGFDED